MGKIERRPSMILWAGVALLCVAAVAALIVGAWSIVAICLVAALGVAVLGVVVLRGHQAKPIEQAHVCGSCQPRDNDTL